MRFKLSNPVLDIALKSLVILAPTLVSLLLVFGFTPKKVNTYTPILEDEIEYWREALTFKESGFNGGYYGTNENPAKIEFIHFTTWGPTYPALAGTFGRVFGWGFASGPLLNAGLISLALTVFVIAIQPDRRMLLALLLLLATFWPIIAFLPLTLEESLNQAIAIILAIIFYRLITNKGHVSRVFSLGSIGFIFCAGLVRLPWALLFFPFVILTKSRFWGWIRLLAALGLCAICFALYQAGGAPYPENSAYLSSFVSAPLTVFLPSLMQHLQRNYVNFTLDTLIMLLQHLQISVFLVLCVAILILLRRSKKELTTERTEIAFHLFNIGAVFGVIILYYWIGQDYRLMAAHLLLSLLLLVAFKRYRMVVMFALSNFMAIIVIFSFYITFVSPHFGINPQQLAAFQQMIEPQIRYQVTENAWCNTILTPAAFAPEMLMLAPQIGVTVLTDAPDLPLNWPPKSRYLLLDSTHYEQIKDKLHVEMLTLTPIGTLFLNQDSKCP